MCSKQLLLATFSQSWMISNNNICWDLSTIVWMMYQITGGIADKDTQISRDYMQKQIWDTWRRNLAVGPQYLSDVSMHHLLIVEQHYYTRSIGC